MKLKGPSLFLIGLCALAVSLVAKRVGSGSVNDFMAGMLVAAGIVCMLAGAYRVRKSA